MTWTNKQKQILVRACKAAGLDDDCRRLVLRQFPNSLFDRGGRACAEPTSTSSRLNNSDFEQVMSIIERHCGGRINLGDSANYSPGYWRSKAADDLHRMRRLVDGMTGPLESAGLLHPGGVGLAGWINTRVADGHTSRLEDLDYHELHALINGLRALARRHGLRLEHASERTRYAHSGSHA